MALGASLALAGSVARRVVLVRSSLLVHLGQSLLLAFWDEVEAVNGMSCRARLPRESGYDEQHGKVQRQQDRRSPAVTP